jgi:hypothetical protein
MGLPIDEEDFTIEMLHQWGEQMKAAADDKSASNKPTIQPPAAFKKETKWRNWKEQFITYLGMKEGHCKAPLTFVIRELEEPAVPEDFEDDHDLNGLSYTTYR